MVDARLQRVVEAAMADGPAQSREGGFRPPVRAASVSNAAGYPSLIEAAPDAMLVHRGVLVYANPAACSMLGYTQAELIGRPAMDIIDPTDREPVLARMAMLDAGHPAEPRDTRFLHHDGSTLVLEVHSLTILFEGRPAVLAMARDISVRRKQEANRIQSNQVHSIGTLAAGLAHEINNPLAYVTTNVSYAARELRELVAAEPLGPASARLRELVEALSDAQEGLERVRGIVGELRSFAFAGADRREPVDLRAVVRASVNIVAGELRRHARIVLDLGDVPRVDAVEGRLGQLFLNLLVNATQAIPPGAPDAHQVTVRTLRDPDGAALVEVSDTGPGIAPEHLPRIFDPYFTTKPVGTGLGLAICHSIVVSLAGTLTVESTPGRGTTFRVRLPAAAFDGLGPATG